MCFNHQGFTCAFIRCELKIQGSYLSTPVTKQFIITLTTPCDETRKREKQDLFPYLKTQLPSDLKKDLILIQFQTNFLNSIPPGEGGGGAFNARATFE